MEKTKTKFKLPRVEVNVVVLFDQKIISENST
jgi:hypothetical protein